MLSLNKALKGVEVGLEKAEQLGVKVTISIMDASGLELVLVRMEGSFAVSPVFARAKALTSGTLGLPTDGIGEYATEGKPYYGINALSGGQFTTIAGGLPVVVDGKVVGGIGVGGSADTNQDKEIAKVIVDSLG